MFHTLSSRHLVQIESHWHSFAQLMTRKNIGTEEEPDVRTVLHFHPAIAPVKIGVLPLV